MFLQHSILGKHGGKRRIRQDKRERKQQCVSNLATTWDHVQQVAPSPGTIFQEAYELLGLRREKGVEFNLLSALLHRLSIGHMSANSPHSMLPKHGAEWALQSLIPQGCKKLINRNLN